MSSGRSGSEVSNIATRPATFIVMNSRVPSRVMRISCGQPPRAIVVKSKTGVARPARVSSRYSRSSSMPAVYARAL